MMSRVTKVKKREAAGEIQYRLNWRDNHGVLYRCFYGTRQAAEEVGLAIEMELFEDARQRLLKSGPSQEFLNHCDSRERE